MPAPLPVHNMRYTLGIRESCEASLNPGYIPRGDRFPCPGSAAALLRYHHYERYVSRLHLPASIAQLPSGAPNIHCTVAP